VAPGALFIHGAVGTAAALHAARAALRVRAARSRATASGAASAVTMVIVVRVSEASSSVGRRLGAAVVVMFISVRRSKPARCCE
jgi:hypothetical protein